jgi:hypothetical protein
MTQDSPQGASRIDIEAALANPSAYFTQPQDVLACPGLSRELQLKILRQWEQDARELAEAESEGMGGGEESMLGRVRQALRTLDLTPKAVAGEAQIAASRAKHAASQIQGGVIEIREVIRAQPITAALFMFAVGYLFGRLGSLILSDARR